MRFLADLRALLRGDRFRQLFTVRLTSQASDGVFQVGLASYILFTPENRPTATAIAAGLTALLLPFSVIGPFVGVFLDRWRRRQILLVSNLVRLGPLVATAALVAAGVTGVALFVVVLLALSVNRFFLAGLSAGLPHVVARRDLVLANSVTPTSGTIAFTIGLAAASGARQLLGGTSGDVVIVLVSGLGYLTAALLTLRMPVDLLGPDHPEEAPRLRTALHEATHGLLAGLRHLRVRTTPAVGLVVIGVHRFLYGLTTVATVLLYRNFFHDSTDTDAGLAGLAAVVAASGLGFFAAAVITPQLTDRIAPQRWMVALLALGSVVELVPGALFTQWGTLVAAFLLGLSAQGVKICVDTLVQVGVDDAFRGRVFALYDVVFNLAFVAAAGVGALVIPTSGKSYPLLVAISAGYALAAVGYGLAWPRLHLDADLRVPDDSPTTLLEE